MVQVVTAGVARKYCLLDRLCMPRVRYYTTALGSPKRLMRAHGYRISPLLQWVLELASCDQPSNVCSVIIDIHTIVVHKLSQFFNWVREQKQTTAKHPYLGSLAVVCHLLYLFLCCVDIYRHLFLRKGIVLDVEAMYQSSS